MYKFIDKYTIEAYDNELLKEIVDGRIVRVVANPSDDILKEFGYKPLEESEIPDYDEESQYVDYVYRNYAKKIVKKYTVKDLYEEVGESDGIQ